MTEEQVISLVKKTIEATDSHEWFDILIAILNWPFLLFAFLIIFVFIYRKKIVSLLERGDIQISWGENRHIKLKELSDGIDEELDPIRDEISELQQRLKAFEANAGAEIPAPNDVDAIADDAPNKHAEERMIDGLKSHKYKWRSIKRLAAIAGITEQKALDILRANRDVVLSIGKSGRQIARMKGN